MGLLPTSAAACSLRHSRHGICGAGRSAWKAQTGQARLRQVPAVHRRGRSPHHVPAALATQLRLHAAGQARLGAVHWPAEPAEQPPQPGSQPPRRQHAVAGGDLLQQAAPGAGGLWQAPAGGSPPQQAAGFPAAGPCRLWQGPAGGSPPQHAAGSPAAGLRVQGRCRSGGGETCRHTPGAAGDRTSEPGSRQRQRGQQPCWQRGQRGWACHVCEWRRPLGCHTTGGPCIVFWGRGFPQPATCSAVPLQPETLVRGTQVRKNSWEKQKHQMTFYDMFK